MTAAAAGRPVALVTGAASGIGAATARRFAQAGCNVAVNYRGNADGAAAVVAECVAAGGEAFAVAGDVSRDADCRRVVQQAVDQWGRLDCLVNNAGTTAFAPAEDLAALSSEDFNRVFTVNVTGAYQMVRAAEPALRAAHGAVVNVSSHSGFSGKGSSTAYAASKGALNTLTLGLARALAPGIRVNAVCPGFVDTEWMAPTLAPAELAEFKARTAEMSPLKLLVSADDVAEAITWFALGARAITGELLVIDGGTHLAVGGPI